MRKKKKRSTYRNSHNSKGFRSGFEATLANQLKRGGVDFQYETLKLEYVKTATYTPDFIIGDIIIEAKGLWTVEDRKKHLLIREQHPHLDIRLVFQNASNKIRKGSNTTYACWCEKKGIKYANKQIPKSWLSHKHTLTVPSADIKNVTPLTTTGVHTASHVMSIEVVNMEEE
jgi:hypothetical protein